MGRKKRLRDMTWDDYGISRNRRKELEAFCLQYEEKRRKIQSGISSVQVDGIPGSNYKEGPVEKQAIQNSTYLHDVRMIEEAAIRANPGIWKYLLKSAEGCRMNALNTMTSWEEFQWAAQNFMHIGDCSTDTWTN